MSRLLPAASALAAASALLCNPAEAGPRAFVASYGNDSNAASSCAPTTPCRSFATALTVVDVGGEIVALDAAGYGAPTITKSVSLIANPGVYAGVAATSGNAITIATAGINVVLRGLSIKGVGATNGVVMSDGASLKIENCVISGFSAGGGSGVWVTAAADVRIVDSVIRDNYYGVYAQGGSLTDIANARIVDNSNTGIYAYSVVASSLTHVAVTDSIIAGNGIGVHAYETNASALTKVTVIRSTVSNGNIGLSSEFAGGPTVITLSDSLVVQNSTGLSNGAPGSTFETLGNNTVRSNGPDVGTITTVALR